MSRLPLSSSRPVRQRPDPPSAYPAALSPAQAARGKPPMHVPETPMRATAEAAEDCLPRLPGAARPPCRRQSFFRRAIKKGAISLKQQACHVRPAAVMGAMAAANAVRGGGRT
eukprot:scaffold11629_cov131-Isochrysis_galbana.AAC.8